MKANKFIPNIHGYGDYLSPDGKYRLVIASYPTRKGCWDYTQGLVYRVGADKPIFEVRRNYASFPYSWIDHPNGHQYLVCGEDYQGQTVLELDTGKRVDFRPSEAKTGGGFCWSETRFDQATKILTVCGCIWAWPYEFRFYDFSDPMKGWPEIVPDDECSEDSRWPTFEPDSVIKTYYTKAEEEDEDGNEIPDKPPVLRATKTFVREGLKLRLLNENVSEDEKTLRKEREEAHQKHEEKMKRFKETDPLFLAYAKLVKDRALSPEDSCGIGITHENWCPHFKLREQRFCRRIVQNKKKKLTIDLEWGMDTGPIKLVIWKKRNHSEDKWFEHSAEGMNQAFKTVKEIMKGE
jgi:hypothetical protein